MKFEAVGGWAGFRDISTSIIMILLSSAGQYPCNNLMNWLKVLMQVIPGGHMPPPFLARGAQWAPQTCLWTHLISWVQFITSSQKMNFFSQTWSSPSLITIFLCLLVSISMELSAGERQLHIALGASFGSVAAILLICMSVCHGDMHDSASMPSQEALLPQGGGGCFSST